MLDPRYWFGCICSCGDNGRLVIAKVLLFQPTLHTADAGGDAIIGRNVGNNIFDFEVGVLSKMRYDFGSLCKV